jgi:hypothetical protein
MLKKYWWVIAAVALYFTKDKWMPMVGLGNKPNDGGDAKLATIDADENLYA